MGGIPGTHPMSEKPDMGHPHFELWGHGPPANPPIMKRIMDSKALWTTANYSDTLAT